MICISVQCGLETVIISADHFDLTLYYSGTTFGFWFFNDFFWLLSFLFQTIQAPAESSGILSVYHLEDLQH